MSSFEAAGAETPGMKAHTINIDRVISSDPDFLTIEYYEVKFPNGNSTTGGRFIALTPDGQFDPDDLFFAEVERRRVIKELEDRIERQGEQ